MTGGSSADSVKNLESNAQLDIDSKGVVIIPKYLDVKENYN